MQIKVISLFVILLLSISPSAFAYEPSGITQCLKKNLLYSPLQSHIHKTVITTYEGEEECRGIVSGKIDGDCRSTLKRHIINKGRECGHKGSNKEVYDAYKDRANKVYGFRGGFEVEYKKNGKKVTLELDCTGMSISKNVIAGASHCFQHSKDSRIGNYGKFIDIIKYGILYYTYYDRNNEPKRVELKTTHAATKTVGDDPFDSFILFEPIAPVERDNFVDLLPRGASHEDLSIVLNHHKKTETFPKFNYDWVQKYGERGRRELYSQCPPGKIKNSRYGFIYSHRCDNTDGSSGAPISTAAKSLCKEDVSKQLTLLAIDMWDQKGHANSARPISGENLEAIYKFIDRVK